MLRLDRVKNGEKFWVLSKIQKTVQKLYFGRSFTSGRGEKTTSFFESLTLTMAQER
jgi:hypothetical protein